MGIWDFVKSAGKTLGICPQQAKELTTRPGLLVTGSIKQTPEVIY